MVQLLLTNKVTVLGDWDGNSGRLQRKMEVEDGAGGRVREP